MQNPPEKIYYFDEFRFDTVRLSLYHNDRMIKNVGEKPLRVLAVLIENPKKLTAHDEVIGKVWQDNPLGITSIHIAQYISKLRKVFAEFAPGKDYIETVKGRGYSFVGDVSADENEVSTHLQYEPSEYPPVSLRAEKDSGEEIVAPRNKVKFALGFAALAAICLISFTAWTWFSESDEDEIRKAVKESQLYESLVLYKNPASFEETHLDKYWTSEPDLNLNSDRNRIREAVKKLNEESRRYGDETKSEQFEFQTVEINRGQNFAVVKTLEKWFIAVYFNDGTLQKNKSVGPYFVSYLLRKIDGRWLIEKSNTARINRPVPRLSKVEIVSEAKSRQQFYVKLTGQDFEAETISLEIFGAGCPESKPCKISNTDLREFSKMTETAIDNVPLTLASGDFRMSVRNGDSQASNFVSLAVP
ncbi:MAG: winged helix-turn-helix domain-containing protein [Pyrinomonadaceae bacterium]|nr:winged helix-turn-helix domain-containing protein [Pyrinomonadaceae bacterium]